MKNRTGVLLLISGVICLPLISSKETTEIITSGIIQDKAQYEYRCGKHGRGVCYDGVFTVNNKEVTVNHETFHKYRVGNSVILTKTNRGSLSYFQWFVLCYSLLSVSGGLATLLANFLDREILGIKGDG